MKERGIMQLDRFILHPLTGKIFLSLLAGAYLVYLVAFGHVLSTSLFGPQETIIEQPVNTNPNLALKYWTSASMQAASDADQQIGLTSDLTQASIAITQGKAAQQQENPQGNGTIPYPLRTSERAFLTKVLGKNLACPALAAWGSTGMWFEPAGIVLQWNGTW